jgi:hypothetical protein
MGIRGWPARWPGNSHWQPGLAAVIMFTRLAASSVSIAANGSGTGLLRGRGPAVP